MANGGNDLADLGENEDGNMSNWSVSKLISFLKSAFRPMDFAKVEAVLLAKEDKSKLEIETLNQGKYSFFYKFEEERLEKMSLEDELRKCKKECEEMRSAASKLWQENMVLREREKFAEDRCNKLSEEVKRIGDKDKEMIDLRSKNCDLECAKAKAEADMEISRKRFEELDERILNLESDLPMLRGRDDLKNNGIGVENWNSENGRLKPDETGKVAEVPVVPGCDSPPEANSHSPNAGSGRSSPQNIVEIVDIDSDDDCAPVEILSEKQMTHSADNSHSAQICEENGTPTLKRKQTSPIDVGETENGDNDENTSTRKLKMRKLREPVCVPDDCPVNHCSTTTVFSDINEVKKGCATPREGFMVSRQCEQKTVSEQKSQNLMNGFPLDGLCFSEESSASSDSDSDDDSEECIFPSTILGLHRRLGGKTEISHRK